LNFAGYKKLGRKKEKFPKKEITGLGWGNYLIWKGSSNLGNKKKRGRDVVEKILKEGKDDEHVINPKMATLIKK